MVWIMLAITVVCVVIVFAIVMVQKEKGTLVKQARAVTKDMVYENAYIVSNDDGRLIFICDGELYRAKGTMEENFTGVCDIEISGSKVKKIQIKPDDISVSGILGNAGQANYSASKAGVIGLTKAVARELASRGITANAVAPGFVETEMTDVLADAAKENLLSQIPLGRPGNTKDIANAVLFLASDAAGYITGQVLSVDGGMAI